MVQCTVFSVYAPTHRTCQAAKDKFYSDLRSMVDGDSEDVLLIVGDYLNARVGSGKDGGDEWDAVRGRHGVGQRNEAGEVLLSWCSLNGLLVWNTVFQKKSIHKYTWQYPGSKQWHCIDCDYEAEAETDVVDHKLLIGQLKVHFPV